MRSKEDFLVYCCRVCGFDYDALGFEPHEYPWGEHGKTPSFDICFCCGCEFGYNDYSPQTLLKFRTKWKNEGMPFRHQQFKPVGWIPEEQLNNIPEEYR